MKQSHLTTPRGMADCQFPADYSGISEDHSRGWYFIYGLLAGWAIAIVLAVTVGGWQ